MFSVQIWILQDWLGPNILYAVIDGLIAFAYFQMSHRRWFPVPLFFLHAMLGLYHLYALLIGPSPYWAQVFLNRSLDVSLAYIFACAVFRIAIRREHTSNI